MSKELTFRMSKQIIDMSGKPLRKREETILLLLYTIRMFDINQYLPDSRNENVRISINKMNRIFYVLEGKMFSMQFPFSIESDNDKNKIVIYDNITGTIINSLMLSFLMEAFEKMNRQEADFDTMFEIIMESEGNSSNFTTQNTWYLISYLLKYDLGYIRYDIDPEHENGKLHPLNHLDICLDTSATYKIGLNQQLKFDEFRDILDITTESWYFS